MVSALGSSHDKDHVFLAKTYSAKILTFLLLLFVLVFESMLCFSGALRVEGPPSGAS